METHPLGAWVCHAKERLVANHVPFILDRTRGPYGTLLGHVARANSVWRVLFPDTPSVVMFQGAQSYITPSWYPGVRANIALARGRCPPNYIHKLMRGIVGIEIPIDRVDGKLKASQDEDMQDRHGTVKGLQLNHSQQSRNMAELVLNALTSEAPQS